MVRNHVVLFLMWFSIFCLFHVINADVCPPREVSEPCSCYGSPAFAHSTKQNVLDCGHLSKVTDLENILEMTKDYQFGEMRISKSFLKFIPVQIFETKGMSFLFVFNTTLINLLDMTPATEIATITKITLANVIVGRGINWQIFTPFTHLEELFLGTVRSFKISNEFVNSVPDSLKMLTISDSRIKKLPDNSFAKLTNLNTINLSGGKIRSLKRSMFPDHLHNIYLINNKISTLPTDLFTGMNELRRVDFTKNLVTTFDENIFSELPNFSKVIFSENPIICDCQIKWTVNTPGSYEGICIEPVNLKGRSIESLRESDFDHC